MFVQFAVLTWNGGAEHVRIDVDEAVYDALLAQSRRAGFGLDCYFSFVVRFQDS